MDVELQRAILNNIPDQAWLKDAGSRYVLVNDAFMAACGRTEAEIVGSTPDQVWSAEWGQVYLDTDKAVVDSGVRRRYAFGESSKAMVSPGKTPSAANTAR